ncbi:hypothetical protein PACILC2_34610 [Paenibacillus cisolokensis]|uniref:Uncharacterized protein n=1 Tax=Paenibacillus cisolokensis TaxID=1658519 RepID=A0ABQ4NA99_9BACL|nr:hypothetical protein [Paenibacillus cisolokensis]GIQ64893.1 hypothetical protein PACILC2_34610 [Paenibacillus cisolokensis]
MTIITNLTPHEVVIYNAEGTDIIASIPASGVVARVAQTAKPQSPVNGIPVVLTEYGEVDGLPPEQPDVYNIVSIVVAQALAAAGVKRTDILVPDSGPASVVRDPDGKILGVRRLMWI